MFYKAIATAIMSNVLRSAQKDVVEAAKKQVISSQMKAARVELMREIAQKYSEEVRHNVSEYINAIEKSNVEISFEGKPGEAFITRAQGAITELEGYLEKQNPDGPIIKYLKRRYKEEGVNIITGRLYGGHYVGRRSQGIYEIANRMGYAANVDKRKPWLTGSKTSQGIEEMLSEAAKEIFEIMFEDVDFSSEAANLKFFGAASEKVISQSGSGFGDGSTQKRPKGKKRKR